MLAERKLKYFDWKTERMDMENILTWIVYTHPGLNLRDMSVPVKAYQVVEHGKTPEETIDFVSAGQLKHELDQFRLGIFKDKGWVSWQTGIGGVFFDYGNPTYFVPMIDLEVTSTNNLESDTKLLEKHLNALDIDGSIIRSGDQGFGGYFFIGHDPMKYNPNYWRFMGRVLTGFTDGESENAQKARTLGGKLLQANSSEDSVVIAREILGTFPSIKTGQEREGILCDPRWIGHQLIQGFTILRYTPGKSYEDRPLQIAEYC